MQRSWCSKNWIWCEINWREVFHHPSEIWHEWTFWRCMVISWRVQFLHQLKIWPNSFFCGYIVMLTWQVQFRQHYAPCQELTYVLIVSILYACVAKTISEPTVPAPKELFYQSRVFYLSKYTRPQQEQQRPTDTIPTFNVLNDTNVQRLQIRLMRAIASNMNFKMLSMIRCAWR